MKKTKLFTSLAALALVLGLGACSETTEECEECPACPEAVEGEDDTGAGEPEPEHEHTEGEWIITEEGHYRVCLECGEILDAGEHKLSEEYVLDSDDERYHARLCECGYKETQVHQADEEGNCTVCKVSGLNVAGLTYASDDEGETYYISKYDMTINAKDLYIPATYQSKPVVGIGNPSATNAAGSAFAGEGADSGRTSINTLKFVAIPEGVTVINPRAFDGCYSLREIELPESLLTIGSYAFHDCNCLLAISIPGSVTEIATEAFYNCYALQEINLKEGLETIAGSVFDQCYSLTSLDIPSSVNSIGASAFDSCYSLASLLIIPEGVDSIGSNTFTHCTSLTEIVLPSTITSIGSAAFRYDYALQNVYFGGSAEEWSEVSVTSTNNGCLTIANMFYYDEDGSTFAEDPTGNYWKFDEEGNVAIY